MEDLPLKGFVGIPTHFSWMFVYGLVGNYDLYLKKVKGENLWPSFSFKSWQVKTTVFLFIVAGIFFFSWNLSQNLRKGFRESDKAIQAMDRAIEENLGMVCDIDYEVHLSPVRNLYDLDIQLNLRPDQIFDMRSRQVIDNIVREKLASFGEVGRIRTHVAYKTNFKRSQ